MRCPEKALDGVPESKSAGYCNYCGHTIFTYETHYILDDITVCNSFDCKYEAFKKNADKQLIAFADEADCTVEAMDWYYENYARKVG